MSLCRSSTLTTTFRHVLSRNLRYIVLNSASLVHRSRCHRRGTFDIRKQCCPRISSHICQGTYLTVEEGTASFTPSSTAPVVTSTLPVPQTSGTSSATSGAASPSGSSTGQQSGAGFTMAPLSSIVLAGMFALGFVLF